MPLEPRLILNQAVKESRRRSLVGRGIRSGAADVDRDGFVSVDDAYEYAFGELRALEAQQTPQRWLYGAEGDIFLARSPAGVAPATLPDELQGALASRHVQIRQGGVAALGEWLSGADPSRALAARQALQHIADTDVPQVAEAARALLLSASDAGTPGSTLAEKSATSALATDQRSSEPPRSATARSSTFRRGLLVVAVGVLVALVITAWAIMDARQGEEPLAANEFRATSPWRLIIQNNNHCTVTLRARDSNDVWTNRHTAGWDMSFQMRQSGVFRWESTTPECQVTHRPGAGELTLPTVVRGFQGDTDAFQASDTVKVEAQDFNGNSDCDFDLIDSESGDTVDIGKLSEAQRSVVLQTGGRPKVYLANGYCTVRISTG